MAKIVGSLTAKLEKIARKRHEETMAFLSALDNELWLADLGMSRQTT
jgi:hypothetical protein